MNILFLYGGVILPQRGGVERVTTVLADAFAARGNGVFYLSLPRNKSPEANSARQFYLPENIHNTPANRKFFQAFIREKQIDVVINQGGLGVDCSKLSYSAKSVGIPVIAVIHNGLLDIPRNYAEIHSFLWEQKNREFLKQFFKLSYIKKFIFWLYIQKYQKHFKRLCLYSDKVILLAERYKSDLCVYLGRQTVPENVLTIPNPCSFATAGTNLIQKQKEILWCGRIDFSQKRFDLMPQIWEQIQDEFPEWKLTILGGGKSLQTAKDLCSKRKLKRVYFEGFQDPRPYFKRASILCMTSSYEGFPMVLVEAMNFACVPVAFNSYAAAEDIINDGKNGFLIPPMNCKKYVERLSLLMSNEALRKYLSNEAAKKALCFSVDRITDKWMALLKTTVEKK